MTAEVYIYEALRTPRGRAKADGGLAHLSPHALLAPLFHALVERTAVSPDSVGDVILGCVTQHGEQAGNIAKTAAMYAGWPGTVSGVTVNRFCSSGIDAINYGALKIAAGQEQLIVAGGIEMMSRVPLLADAAAVFSDPQYAARCRMLLMGSGADLVATLHDVSRSEADGVALLSQQRAQRALREKRFANVVPVPGAPGQAVLADDECVREDTTQDSLALLSSAFADLGAAGADAVQLEQYPELTAISHIHTAGNSPAMADGAALLLLGSKAAAESLSVSPRARIVAAATACDDPMQVVGGCIAATRRLLQEQDLAPQDVDLFEVHEAFAATVVRLERELGIPKERLNVNGGVIALGHPMGATGAMMTQTLLDELERRGARLGVVAASGAGGSGCALLIARL